MSERELVPAPPKRVPLTPRRLLRIACIVSAFALFWGVAFFQAWIGFPLRALVHRDEVARIRSCQRSLARWFRYFHRYMRALGLFDAELDITLPEHDGPVVIVANHVTLVDVTVILAALPHTCCIVNPLYYNNPLIGRAARLGGFLNGHAERGPQGTLALAQRRLDQGFNLLVFPEGTRSPPGGLLPFRRGAFEIAKRTQTPLVPLVLRCEPSALTKGQPITQLPNVIAKHTTQVLPLVSSADPDQSSRRLCEAVHQTYHRVLFPTRIPKISS